MSENQTQATKTPNVRLAHGQLPICINGEVNIGATPGMFLPSEEQQRRGFWVSHPEVLITQYYPRYKYFRVLAAAAVEGKEQTLEEVARDQQSDEAKGGANPDGDS